MDHGGPRKQDGWRIWKQVSGTPQDPKWMRRNVNAGAQLLPPVHPKCWLSYHGNCGPTGQETYRVMSQTSSPLLLLPFSLVGDHQAHFPDKLPDYNQSSRVNPVAQVRRERGRTPQSSCSPTPCCLSPETRTFTPVAQYHKEPRWSLGVPRSPRKLLAVSLLTRCTTQGGS